MIAGMINITEENAVCRASEGGRVLFETPVAFHPQKALDLLRDINALQTESGEFIYSLYKQGDTHLWPLLQEHLYWEYLQSYIKYRDVINWLSTQDRRSVQTNVRGLMIWMDLMDGNFAQKNAKHQSRGIRHKIEVMFLFLNAILCGLFVRLTGSRFLLWSLNCVWSKQWIDYRLKDVYAMLWEEGFPFLEGFPFPGFKNILKRLLGSRRLAFYAPNVLRVSHEACQTTHHVDYRWNSVADLSPDLLRKLVSHFEILMNNMSRQSHLMERLMKLAHIHKIVGIDEHTSFGAMICAARAAGISTLGLQHGVFHKYSIGWTTPGIPSEFTAGYNEILVWGPFWRDLLAKLSSTYRDFQLIPAGFIRPCTVSFRPRSCQPDSPPFKILLPYEFLANPEEIAAYITAFQKRGFKVYFKVRFDDTLDQQLHMLPRENLELVPELTQELLDSMHVCAGTSTTMMYEFYCLGMPVWFISTEHDSNIHMVENGLAAKITLDMLEDSNFDPFQHILPACNSEHIFSKEGMPEVLKSHLANERKVESSRSLSDRSSGT